MNLLKGQRVGRQSLRLADAVLAAPFPASTGEAEPDVTFGIRPEHLGVGHEMIEGRSLSAIVDFSEYLGGTQYLYCQLSDGQAVTVEYRSPVPVKPGDRIVLSWTPEAIRCLIPQARACAPRMPDQTSYRRGGWKRSSRLTTWVSSCVNSPAMAWDSSLAVTGRCTMPPSF